MHLTAIGTILMALDERRPHVMEWQSQKYDAFAVFRPYDREGCTEYCRNCTCSHLNINNNKAKPKEKRRKNQFSSSVEWRITLKKVKLVYHNLLFCAVSWRFFFSLHTNFFFDFKNFDFIFFFLTSFFVYLPKTKNHTQTRTEILRALSCSFKNTKQEKRPAQRKKRIHSFKMHMTTGQR